MLKKILYIVGGLIVLFVIVGMIGGGGSPEEPSEGNKTTEETSVYSINEEVKVGNVKWKLLDATDRGGVLKASNSQYPSMTDDKEIDGRFVQITMKVENQGKEMRSVSTLKLIDSESREYTAASETSDWIPDEKEMFLLDNINPGITQEFISMYKVPSDASGLKVKVGDLKMMGNEEALIKLGL